MLACGAGEAIARHALQVVLQAAVATGDPGQGTFAMSDNPRPVAVVTFVMRSARSCERMRPVFRSDHAAGRVEQPGIGIPLARGRGVTTVGARSPFHRIECWWTTTAPKADPKWP